MGISALISGGAGIASGLLNKPKTSTSSTTPTLSPEMKALQDRLAAYSNDEMVDPSKGLAPIRTAGLDNINRTFMDIPSRLSSQFASRGYGSSGDFGSSLYKTEYARGGAISDLEGQLAAMANSNRAHGADIGQRLLNSGQGSTSTSTGPDTSVGSGINSGLSTLTSLFTLSQLLKGGGSDFLGPKGYVRSN
jgi:hypothetical protein